MFGLLFSLLKARRINVLPYLNIVLVFIAAMLLIFLCFACYRPSSSFSQIYLVEVHNSTHTMRSGYFKMCDVAGNSTSCAKIGQFKSTGLGYEFAKRVSRPYFVMISTVLVWLVWVNSIVLALHPILQVKQANFVLTLVTLGFTTITACWQEVAVQAAVVLIPNEVKKGHRAAGMVWSALAMLILSLFTNINAGRKQETKDAVSVHSEETDFSKMHYVNTRVDV